MTRKQCAALLLSLCLALGLTACRNEEKWVEGLVVEVQRDEAGDPTAFVVEDSQGKRTGVRLVEETRVWPRGSGSWTEEELRAAVQADLRVDAWVYAGCHPWQEKLETADGTVKAYQAASAVVSGELKREAATLRDGTAVDVLEWDSWSNYSYRLADGTELLEVDEPRGPADYYAGAPESFADLSETAQRQVRQYYEDRGLLYDEMDALEQCYAAWKELGEAYRSGHIQQTVAPSASSERVMYFTTELTLPQEYGTPLCTSTSFQDAFDRRTGERLEVWDLFTVPEAEVRKRLPELVDWELNPIICAEMSQALEPEWIRFGQGGLTVFFPAGSLPSEELGYHVSVDCENIPEGFVQPWAVPGTWEAGT